MKTVEKSKWRFKWAGRWTTTHMARTEEDIKREHPETVRIGNFDGGSRPKKQEFMTGIRESFPLLHTGRWRTTVPGRNQPAAPERRSGYSTTGLQSPCTQLQDIFGDPGMVTR